jgi:hypothetical protein
MRACVVKCVNFLLEFINANFFVCRVITYLCTYLSKWVVFSLLVFFAACLVLDSNVC